MTANVPAGELVYAVGDIHGRSDLLTGLLHQIESDAARFPLQRKTLIFLGDYVDRGPDSRGVVETLLHGLPKDFAPHFLKGNHEQILLDFLDDPRRIDHWRLNGGEATMMSYGVDVEALWNSGAPARTWRDAFAAVLPPPHLNFFQSLELRRQIGDFFFVHAGVRPGVPLDAQDADDLVWIRDEFLQSNELFGKVVVHGHTPGREPVVRSNRIGIDTGAVFSGRLTALRIVDGDTGFLRMPPA